MVVLGGGQNTRGGGNKSPATQGQLEITHLDDAANGGGGGGVVVLPSPLSSPG